MRDPGTGERLALFDPKTRARGMAVSDDEAEPCLQLMVAALLAGQGSDVTGPRGRVVVAQ